MQSSRRLHNQTWPSARSPDTIFQLHSALKALTTYSESFPPPTQPYLTVLTFTEKISNHQYPSTPFPQYPPPLPPTPPSHSRLPPPPSSFSPPRSLLLVLSSSSSSSSRFLVLSLFPLLTETRAKHTRTSMPEKVNCLLCRPKKPVVVHLCSK